MLSIYETKGENLIDSPELIDSLGNGKIAPLNGQGVELIVTPFQLVSFWDMLPFFASTLVVHLNDINLDRFILNKRIADEGANARILQVEVNSIRDKIRFLRADAEEVQMARTLERLCHLEPQLFDMAAKQLALSLLVFELEELVKAIRLDLQSKKFFYMPPDESVFYSQDDLFGVKDRFPEANKEITVAGNCYATENYTACVFHLMRAVEVVLKRMIVVMKARKYLLKPPELCDWGMLIQGLEKAKDALAFGTKTNARKKATYAFYSEAIQTFKEFRDAWRNTISHGNEVAIDKKKEKEKRKLFKQGETEDIMKSTRHFLTHLAKRIKE